MRRELGRTIYDTRQGGDFLLRGRPRRSIIRFSSSRNDQSLVVLLPNCSLSRRQRTGRAKSQMRIAQIHPANRGKWQTLKPQKAAKLHAKSGNFSQKTPGLNLFCLAQGTRNSIGESPEPVSKSTPSLAGLPKAGKRGGVKSIRQEHDVDAQPCLKISIAPNKPGKT